ncbi:hypothetical protein D3C76_906700 [compost metagenome]
MIAYGDHGQLAGNRQPYFVNCAQHCFDVVDDCNESGRWRFPLQYVQAYLVAEMVRTKHQRQILFNSGGVERINVASHHLSTNPGILPARDQRNAAMP